MTAPEDRPDELRAQATLLMAMVDSGKARIEPAYPDDGVGVAWIRVMDAAAIAAAALSVAPQPQPDGEQTRTPCRCTEDRPLHFGHYDSAAPEGP